MNFLKFSEFVNEGRKPKNVVPVNTNPLAIFNDPRFKQMTNVTDVTDVGYNATYAMMKLPQNKSRFNTLKMYDDKDGTYTMGFINDKVSMFNSGYTQEFRGVLPEDFLKIFTEVTGIFTNF